MRVLNPFQGTSLPADTRTKTSSATPMWARAAERGVGGSESGELYATVILSSLTPHARTTPARYFDGTMTRAAWRAT